jgi:hypothetical protein
VSSGLYGYLFHALILSDPAQANKKKSKTKP